MKKGTVVGDHRNNKKYSLTGRFRRVTEEDLDGNIIKVDKQVECFPEYTLVGGGPIWMSVKHLRRTTTEMIDEL